MMPKRCIRSYDQEGMSLVPGFKHFSIENCKVAKVQRAANHFMGCNILAIPQNNPAYGLLSAKLTIDIVQAFIPDCHIVVPYVR